MLGLHEVSVSDALKGNIDNLTHAVRMSAIGSLEQGVVKYAKAIKDRTGSSELNSFQGKLLDKLNHYLWENGGIGRAVQRDNE